MTGVGDDFTCSVCGQTYQKGWSDEEALTETAKIWGDKAVTEPIDIVCDGCWRAMMGLPPAEEDGE